MLNNDTKKAYETALNLEATVIMDAENAAKRMTDEVKARKIEVIKSAKREAELCAERFETTEKKRIQLEFSNRIADRESHATKELIKKRAEIQSAVFEKLSARLTDFAKTENYKLILEKLAEKAASASLSDDLTVYISQNPFDKEVADKYFSGAATEIATDIVLGGIRVRDNSRGMLYDLTLDSRFEAEKERFLSISALKLGG